MHVTTPHVTTPMEPTEENLQKEAKKLEKFLLARWLVRGTVVRNIHMVAESLVNDESFQIKTQDFFRRRGFRALATRDGIDWLIRNFGSG